MRLRKPCEHGCYDLHFVLDGVAVIFVGDPSGDDPAVCPGGEFLPADTLVWVCLFENKVRFARDIPWRCECGSSMCPGHERCDWMRLVIDEAADQVGESE